MTFLLDVNVLIALIDPAHVHHDIANRWFKAEGRRDWATCLAGPGDRNRAAMKPSFRRRAARSASTNASCLPSRCTCIRPALSNGKAASIFARQSATSASYCSPSVTASPPAESLRCTGSPEPKVAVRHADNVLAKLRLVNVASRVLDG